MSSSTRHLHQRQTFPRVPGPRRGPWPPPSSCLCLCVCVCVCVRERERERERQCCPRCRFRNNPHFQGKRLDRRRRPNLSRFRCINASRSDMSPPPLAHSPLPLPESSPSPSLNCIPAMFAPIAPCMKNSVNECVHRACRRARTHLEHATRHLDTRSVYLEA